MNDILNSKSPEMKELLSLIEELKIYITKGIKNQKLSLSGEQFLDNNELCKILHVSKRCLQDYRDRGLLPFYKVEGKILYKTSDIQQLLNDNYNQAFAKF
ncbi:helix-turn-helix domain-containing protein [Dysgonomonas sp. Marseille-P4677]|uniref:helix-turn-helix domain-containing protein n=1 Tax=Dysgonomonas sp. Marseille-P4677 TaxID=2364790 RepID=UPI00191394CC|nr:helix-turn-helix domain-containing protein [Dysgonomonas sp. Marseille-P4677]MBK5719527.1 helix-turn-helix domain-containing protein [Dysgonomonas sp. Marseille-P4677]